MSLVRAAARKRLKPGCRREEERAGRVSRGLCGLIGILLSIGTAQAEAPADLDTSAQKTQLQAVQGDLAKAQAKAEALRRQEQAVAAEIASLREASVATARIAQQNEVALSMLQAQLKSFQDDTREKLAAVQATHGREARLLAALQRVAIEPPAALAFSPGSPLDSIRSAMLLASIMPQLRAAVADLNAKLGDLDKSRLATEATQAEVGEKQIALTAQQEHLADLLARKRQLESATRRAAAAEQRRLTALSAQAVDLKDLIQKLDAERARRLEQERAETRRREQAEAARQRAEAEAAHRPTDVAMAAPQRTRSLLAGKYTLVRPAAGPITRRFGQTDGFVTAKGLTIATRPGAEVVAPYDGTILFAGPFRSYGQILIIEHPGGYDSLLAGCDHIDSVVGQSVKAGEPVGRMRTGGGTPSLYFEWRRKDQPIDPASWLAAP